MTLPEAFEVLEYWQEFPPEHEMLALLSRVYTTWQPGGGREMTPAEHQASLERRWKSGYLNVKQMMAIMGGRSVKPGDKVPGIGYLPGMEPREGDAVH